MWKLFSMRIWRSFGADFHAQMKLFILQISFNYSENNAKASYTKRHMYILYIVYVYIKYTEEKILVNINSSEWFILNENNFATNMSNHKYTPFRFSFEQNFSHAKCRTFNLRHPTADLTPQQKCESCAN